jgi:hypothetical protein
MESFPSRRPTFNRSRPPSSGSPRTNRISPFTCHPAFWAPPHFFAMSLKTTGPSRLAAFPKRVAHLRKSADLGRGSRAHYPPRPLSRPPTTSTTPPSSSTTASSSSSSSLSQQSSKARLAVGLPPPPRTSSPQPSRSAETAPSTSRQRVSTQQRLVFDSGAYGIPKSGNGTASIEIGMGRLALVQPGVGGAGATSTSSAACGAASATATDDLCHSVGEDAYFRKGDALGVFDGVGGWKTKNVVGADAGQSHPCPCLFRRSSVNCSS